MASFRRNLIDKISKPLIKGGIIVSSFVPLNSNAQDILPIENYSLQKHYEIQIKNHEEMPSLRAIKNIEPTKYGMKTISNLLGGETENEKFPSNIGHILKKRIPTYSIMFTSGMADALSENLKWHYYRDFKPTFPNVDDENWNPDLSYKKKYKNGNPKNGAAWPGSTTWGVAFTDPYHLSNTYSRLSMLGSVFINLGSFKNAKWWHYAIDFGANMISFSLGWHFMDNVVIRGKPWFKK